MQRSTSLGSTCQEKTWFNPFPSSHLPMRLFLLVAREMHCSPKQGCLCLLLRGWGNLIPYLCPVIFPTAGLGSCVWFLKGDFLSEERGWGTPWGEEQGVVVLTWCPAACRARLVSFTALLMQGGSGK